MSGDKVAAFDVEKVIEETLERIRLKIRRRDWSRRVVKCPESRVENGTPGCFYLVNKMSEWSLNPFEGFYHSENRWVVEVDPEHLEEGKLFFRCRPNDRTIQWVVTEEMERAAAKLGVEAKKREWNPAKPATAGV